MQYADHSELERNGRPFRCSSCLVNPTTGKARNTIKKTRRCDEDRWDFDEKDGAAFPIQISPGGPTFGFCPAKVLKDDQETVIIFQILIAILETGTWPNAGGLYEQEEIWVELVSDFAAMRRSLEFNERFSLVAKSLDGKGITKGGLNGSGKAKTSNRSRGKAR